MISVCIATYNGEKYIKEQIDSILCQLSCNDEIIISDDSSCDRTLEIIRNYNDPRIKIYEGNQFHSPIFNFENAINKASGEYIFLCDQDDVWLDSKITKVLKYLQNYSLVVTNCKVVDCELNIINPSLFSILKSRPGFLANYLRNSYIGCCMAFNRKILDYVLPFPKRMCMHDVWIGLLVELYDEVYFLDEPLMLYRRHEKNISSTAQRSKYNLVQKIQYRIVLLINIFKRKFLGL